MYTREGVLTPYNDSNTVVFASSINGDYSSGHWKNNSCALYDELYPHNGTLAIWIFIRLLIRSNETEALRSTCIIVFMRSIDKQYISIVSFQCTCILFTKNGCKYTGCGQTLRSCGLYA